MPYGTVTDHGTMFVGFCAEQRPLQAMLESMGWAHERRARRADEVHAAADRRVLLHPVDAEPAPLRRRVGTRERSRAPTARLLLPASMVDSDATEPQRLLACCFFMRRIFAAVHFPVRSP